MSRCPAPKFQNGAIVQPAIPKTWQECFTLLCTWQASVVSSLCNTTLLQPQGMIVAILFCLINNEVIFQVKKFFADRTGVGQQGGRHPSLALTQYTVSTNYKYLQGGPN